MCVRLHAISLCGSQRWISHRSLSIVSLSKNRATERANVELDLWSAAVGRLEAEQVLPLGFGGVAAANTAAWHGDKILGAAIAGELRSHGLTEVDQLSRAYAVVSSNANLAANVDALLPNSLLAQIPMERRLLQEHDCGTIVEACVDLVANAGNAAAIDELARYLVASVGTASAIAEVPTNPKSMLIELGGSLSSDLAGGSAHMPVYRAEATLGDLYAEAQGGSKKGAERDAATTVLQKTGIDCAAQLTQRQRLDLIDKLNVDKSNKMAATAARQMETNPKGVLLSLGGFVTSEPAGGPAHMPVYRAEANLGDLCAEVEGSSVKGAERAAAMAVLQKTGLLAQPSTQPSSQ